MGVTTGISTVLGVAGLGTSLFGRSEQEQQQEKAIELQNREQIDAYNQRQTQQTRRLNETMASQNARQGASGFSLSSPSFNAVQRDSINQFDEDQNADALGQSFSEINSANEDENAQQNEFWGDVGDIFNTTNSFNQGAFSKFDKEIL